MDDAWIDVSVPLFPGMVHWPDNPPVRIEPLLSMRCGDVCNVSTLSMGSHTGTHMDAPHHFVDSGMSIDQIPLDACVGSARVVAIEDSVSITRGELEPLQLTRGERVLFKTENSKHCWDTDHFVPDFVYISAGAATYLAECGVRTVGVDYLSVGGYEKDGAATHRALLDAGVWIIEGLNLAEIEPGLYEMIALPLKIRGGDGAPARVILRAGGRP